MAGFEQNQQDAFNQRNDAESIKRSVADLDKLAESIGEAELAAEKELAKLRFANLEALQEEKLKKLEDFHAKKLKKLGDLLALEQQGIEELSNSRLTLSDKQFEARKKQIQEELKLSKEAIEELRKFASKKFEAPSSKSATVPKNTTSSQTKTAHALQEDSKELINLVSSIDGTLSTLRDTIASLAQTKEKGLPAGKTEQASQQPVTEAIKASKTDTSASQVDASSATSTTANTGANGTNDSEKSGIMADSAKSNVPSQQTQPQYAGDGMDHGDKVDIGNYSPEKILAEFNKLHSSLTTGIESLLNQVIVTDDKGQTVSNKISQASLDLTGSLLESIKIATKAEEDLQELRKNGALNSSLLFEAEMQRLKGEHSNTEKTEIETRAKTEAKAQDIKDNEAAYYQEDFAKQLQAYADEQNRLDLARINNAAILDYQAYKRDEIIAQETDKLTRAHEDAIIKAQQTRMSTEAKHNDLINNREAYALEARIARENAFYAERNRLEEERIRIEEEIAWNAANRDDILAQEKQKTSLKYLAEYQALQSDSWNHLTENMTLAEFEKIRSETAAIEEAIEHRSDLLTASEKALATIRGKGTLKEKKELLKNQIKEQAAKKDWEKSSGRKEGSKADERYKERFVKTEITDSMSAEEKAAAEKRNEQVEKNQQTATAASMAVNAAASALSDFAQKLSSQTDEIAKVQGILDTRLQGSRENEKFLFSYGKQLQKDAKWIAGANPYMSQEKLVENMQTLVAKGVAWDIKQRAFLMTVQEKIANTFDVADGTLLRLIRIQQQDTTAGRLGMESALTSFLNSMYETSEYMTDVAKSVRGSLEEMQALMEGKDATELEYQVQKWMGSLYSVGMSQSAVEGIAKTFGELASGDISGITGNGTSNLLIMAANEAGMSIADILQDGLKADETNKLMQAMVNYLAEIAETSSDSKVVQQQLANVYGIKASDLRAATNLSTSLKDVAKEDKSYFGMMLQLNNMMNTLGLRTSIGEGLSNMWNNMSYTMASSMAANPIAYVLPKLSKLLKDTTGGIDLPFINVYGFGVDLNTTVSDLMNVAAMAPAVLGSLGPVLVGLSDLVNPLAGTTMLARAGINPFEGALRVLARGTPATMQNTSGAGLSESGSIVGQSDGNSIKDQTLQGAEDDKKKQMVEAKEEETADDIAMKADLAVVNIYNLLEEVAHGSQYLRVKVVNGGVCSGGGSGNVQNSMGSNNETPSTTAATGSALNGADNGNWVLSF